MTEEEFEYYIKHIWHWDYTIDEIYYEPNHVYNPGMPTGDLIVTITWEAMSQEALDYIDDNLCGVMYINYGYHHINDGTGYKGSKTWYNNFLDRPDMFFLGAERGGTPTYSFRWSLCMDDHWYETGEYNPGGLHSEEKWDMGHYELYTDEDLSSSGSCSCDFSLIFKMSMYNQTRRYCHRMIPEIYRENDINYLYQNTYKHYFAFFGWFGEQNSYSKSRAHVLKYMTCPKVSMYTYNNNH